MAGSSTGRADGGLCSERSPRGDWDSEAGEAKRAVCFTRTFWAGNTPMKTALSYWFCNWKQSFAKLKIHHNRESYRNHLFNPSPRGDCC